MKHIIALLLSVGLFSCTAPDDKGLFENNDVFDPKHDFEGALEPSCNICHSTSRENSFCCACYSSGNRVDSHCQAKCC